MLGKRTAIGWTANGVQLVRYALVGLVNTAVGLGTILTLQEVVGLGSYVSNVIGFGAGLLVSFLLNRTWTFSARDQGVRRAARFVGAFGIAYGANLAVLTILIGPLGRIMAQIGAITVYTAVFFILCRWFVFAPARGNAARTVRTGRSSRP